MDDIAAAFDDIGYLSGSPTRVEVLQHLIHESLSRSQLESRCDASRVTLGRVLSSLEERGWIVQTEREYRATPLGKLICTEFLSLCRTVESVRKLQQIADVLPPAFDLDPRLLADAELTVSTRADPLAPVTAFLEDPGSERCDRVLTPIAGPEAMEQSLQAVLEHGLEFQLAVSSDLLEAIRGSTKLDDRFQKLLAQESVEARVLEEDLPYMIAIGEDRVYLGFTDEDRIPRALLTCSNEAATDWCLAEFERRWSAAKPVAEYLTT
ncbi:helix-turn-helix transcriptional regulator [Natronomonas sp. EA1]|uniref:helix-turn-helix transcriptional regulator n=1 Tax=Natronomonas sp. EA1 TaxID=3421655 RepID=UPI003EBA5138